MGSNLNIKKIILKNIYKKALINFFLKSRKAQALLGLASLVSNSSC
jgi:hypothetical protein